MADAASPGDAITPSRFDPYGPNANADETRQAQHMEANDAPLDVNMNAIVARSQSLTFDVAGKNFESNADRRNKIFDSIIPKVVTG